MKSAYRVIAENNFRTGLLMVVFLGLVFSLSYLFAYFLENRAIFWGGVILGILVNFWAIFLGDRAILALTGAKEIKKNDYPEIYNLVDNLSIAAGLPKTPNVYLINSPALNAFATGKSPKNSYVVLTTGIIQRLNKEELEGVIAHEISHIKNLDIRLMMMTAILAGLIAIMADMFLRISLAGGGDKKKNNGIFLIIGLVLAILAPIFAQLVQLAISRKREYLADASAALLTRNPEGLASALETISKNPIELNVSPSTANLFIVNPFRGKKNFVSWLGNLFSTHPPVEERIKILRGMIGKI